MHNIMLATIKLKGYISFAIEKNGVMVLNKNTFNTGFIAYPEAAIFLIIIRNYDKNKTCQMISSIINLEQSECNSYIIQCLNKWQHYFN